MFSQSHNTNNANNIDNEIHFSFPSDLDIDPPDYALSPSPDFTNMQEVQIQQQFNMWSDPSRNALSSTCPVDTMNCSLEHLRLDDKACCRSPELLSKRDPSPDAVVRIREETRKLLVLCLSSQMRPNQDLKSVEKMAHHLEERLYQIAPTLADYSNVSTLESRLRVVLQMLRRKTNNKRQKLAQRELARQQRETCLRRCLGEARYNQVDDLVGEISHEQNELVGSNCPKCQVMDKFKGGSFGTQLPEPVRKIFFSTPLLQVWQEYSIQRLCGSMTSMDWDSLISQAEANLHEYQQWKAQYAVCRLR
eukprot:Nitzschia sp. Nitz4//scaffold104_size75438//53166//54183//NITZ4_005663-RA/size75438-snap-gene-0.117-mRNA-1//1//CDS//3329532407//3760//frame0